MGRFTNLLSIQTEVYSALSSAIPAAIYSSGNSPAIYSSGSSIAAWRQTPLKFAWPWRWPSCFDRLCCLPGPGGSFNRRFTWPWRYSVFRYRLCCWLGPGGCHIQTEFCSCLAAIASAWTRLFFVEASVAWLLLLSKVMVQPHIVTYGVKGTLHPQFPTTDGQRHSMAPLETMYIE